MKAPKENSRQSILRKIPSVDKILEYEDVEMLLQKYSRGVVLKSIQNILERMREKLLSAKETLISNEKHSIAITAKEIEDEIQSLSKPHLEKVINATGVVLHTNLGRSLLSDESIENIREIA
ncbi:unnamed protein product, partial [marine sediment metagenome]